MELLAEGYVSDYFKNSYGQLLEHILAILSTIAFTVCKIYGEFSAFPENSNTFALIPHVDVRLSYDADNTNISQQRLIAAIESGCNSFLILQEPVFDFMDAYISTHDAASYRNPEKYLVILMDHGHVNDSNVLEGLRDHPGLKEVVNLLILQPSDQLDSIDILTHRYVGSDEYSSEFYLLDRYDVVNRSFQYGNYLFPDKTVDLQGRAIHVATFNVTPHIDYEIGDPSVPVIRTNNTSYKLGGVDGFIVTEFCRLRNCSVEMVIDQVHMWGEIYENKTGTGILGNMVERRADLGVAGIGGWYHCLKYLSFSMPVQRGSVTCLAPKPELMSRWKIIAMAFSTSVYLTILLTFVILVLLYLLVAHLTQPKSKRNSVTWNLLNVSAILLMQGTFIRKRNLSEVWLSLAALLFALNMGSIYSGKNASLRTIPLFKPSIDTAYDLADSEIIWLQTHEAWANLLLLSENPTIQRLVSKFKALPEQNLRQVADQGGSAFALARLQSGYLMLGEWFTAENIHKYQLMKDDLYYVYEFTLSTKTWPLLGRLNQLLLNEAQGLLFVVPQLRSLYKYNDFYVQMAALHSHDRVPNEPKPLNVVDISGPFFLLAAGLLFAAVVFVFELITAKQRSRTDIVLSKI